MDPSATRLVGRTGVAVTQLGLGGASYAELFYKVPEQDAFWAIQAAWAHSRARRRAPAMRRRRRIRTAES